MKSGVILSSISDHSLVFCILKVGVTKAKPRIIEFRSYKSYNANTFIEDLNNVPWHVVQNEDNVDDAVLTWNKLFLEVADSHAPIETSCERNSSSIDDTGYFRRNAKSGLSSR